MYYDNFVICHNDTLNKSIIHEPNYVDPDPSLSLLEFESQNVVFIFSFPPIKEIRGLQALASTSTLSPFPDLGTRTWEGTLLTYGSGRIVCTGHKTVNEAIMNINSLSRTFSMELKQPLQVIRGELTNLVASGRLKFSLDQKKLRQHKNARFTTKFDGTTFNAVRDKAKELRVSFFQSGRFNIPGLRTVKEGKMALQQLYPLIKLAQVEDEAGETVYRPGRNTTRKRRRIRDW